MRRKMRRKSNSRLVDNIYISITWTIYIFFTFVIKDVALLTILIFVILLLSIVIFNQVLGDYRLQIFRHLKEKMIISSPHEKIYHELFPYGYYIYLSGLSRITQDNYLEDKGVLNDKHLLELVEGLRRKNKILSIFLPGSIVIIIICIVLKILLEG